MRTTLFSSALLLSLSYACCVESSFRLVMHDSQVNVYARRRGSCAGGGGPEVLFLMENRTPHRLELSMDLLSLKSTSRLTLKLEPSGTTSVLSTPSDEDPCEIEVIGMRIQAPPEPKADEKMPRPAAAGAAVARN
jgi:hypothetical protein